MNKMISYVELVDLVCNGNAPKNVKYEGNIYHLGVGKNNYYNKEIIVYKNVTVASNIKSFINMIEMKDKNIEILEDENTPKKIEKLNYVKINDSISRAPNNEEITRKINELIDYIKI